MLKGEIRENCSKLLHHIRNYKELLSLVDTVTSRQIKVTNQDEAVRVILDYTQAPIELLKRKKIKRDYLFQYLTSCNVVVAPNSEKKSLIEAVLKQWNVEIAEDLEIMEFEEDISDHSDGNIPAHQVSLAAAESDAASASTSTSSVTAYNNNQKTEFLPTKTESHTKLAAPYTHTEAQQFAEQFTEWFYRIWNSCTHENTEFGPQHFFENCTSSLFIKSVELKEENLEGNKAVCERFAQFVIVDGLSFNPNPQGVQGLTDVYGRYIVNVCGTLHQQQNAVGLFEQQFGMIRDPNMENNWRVKFVKLKMESYLSSNRTVEGHMSQAIASPPSSNLVPCRY